MPVYTHDQVVKIFTRKMLPGCPHIYNRNFMTLCLQFNTEQEELNTQPIATMLARILPQITLMESHFKPSAEQLRALQTALQQRAVHDNQIEQQSLELALNTYASYSEQLKKNPVHKADTPRLWTRMLSVTTRCKLSLCLHIKALQGPLTTAEQSQLQTLTGVFQEGTQPPAITDAAATEWFNRISNQRHRIRLDDVIVIVDLLQLNSTDQPFLDTLLQSVNRYPTRKRELEDQRQQQIQHWCDHLEKAYDQQQSSSVFHNTNLSKATLLLPEDLLRCLKNTKTISGASIEAIIKPIRLSGLSHQHVLLYRLAELQPLLDVALEAQQRIKDFSIEEHILTEIASSPNILKQQIIDVESSDDKYQLKHRFMAQLAQCRHKLITRAAEISTIADIRKLFQQHANIIPFNFTRMSFFNDDKLDKDFVNTLGAELAETFKQIKAGTPFNDLIYQLIQHQLNRLQYTETQSNESIINELTQFLLDDMADFASTRDKLCRVFNIHIDLFNPVELKYFSRTKLKTIKQQIHGLIKNFAAIKPIYENFENFKSIYLCLPTIEEDNVIKVITQQDALLDDCHHTRGSYIEKLAKSIQTIEHEHQQIDLFCQENIAVLYNSLTFAEEYNMQAITNIINKELEQNTETFNQKLYQRAQQHILKNHEKHPLLGKVLAMVTARLKLHEKKYSLELKYLKHNTRVNIIRFRVTAAEYKLLTTQFSSAYNLFRPNGFHQQAGPTIISPDKPKASGASDCVYYNKMGNLGLCWSFIAKRLEEYRGPPLRSAPGYNQRVNDVEYKIEWSNRPHNKIPIHIEKLHNFCKKLCEHGIVAVSSATTLLDQAPEQSYPKQSYNDNNYKRKLGGLLSLAKNPLSTYYKDQLIHACSPLSSEPS